MKKIILVIFILVTLSGCDNKPEKQSYVYTISIVNNKFTVKSKKPIIGGISYVEWTDSSGKTRLDEIKVEN